MYLIVSVKERPLIYPSELQQLNSPNNMGNAIINIFGFSPIKTKFTPSYKCKKFVFENTQQKISVGKYFNEEQIFYNMLTRNEKVLPKKKSPANLLVEIILKTIKNQIQKLPNEIFNSDEQLEIIKSINDKNFDRATQFLI